MAYGSLLSIPFFIFLIFPTLSESNRDSTSFFFSAGFVYVTTLITTFLNGFGGGIA
jgi:predicted CDP-diglyceride synthetase/phosphatidate cytidylyltransferase